MFVTELCFSSDTPILFEKMNSKETICPKCQKEIDNNAKCEIYQGKIYHTDCFKCSNIDCGMKLTPRTVEMFNRKPYCRNHVPENVLDDRLSYSDHIYVNVPQSEYDEIEDSSAHPVGRNEAKKATRPSRLREEMRTILLESSPRMVDEIFSGLSRDMNIVVCGSPRVGKSTLINVICGREVAKACEGLASVTQTIQCYTLEGQCDTGSNIIHYKYNFWDTPGFESWERGNIKSKMKEIIEKPETKPLCMIFCASPGTFVDLTQLEWLLDLCITKKHIFCALVCTNKYAGQAKNRRAVLADFNQLLSKYVSDPPRIEDQITFYGNIGLCAAVNSEPYEDDDRTLPVVGTNELVLGIMESLVDEQVFNWCLIILENEGFWNDCQKKVSGLFDRMKFKMKTLKKLFDKRTNQNLQIHPVSDSTK